MRYEVTFTRKYTVTAKTREEAENQAFNMLDIDLDIDLENALSGEGTVADYVVAEVKEVR